MHVCKEEEESVWRGGGGLAGLSQTLSVSNMPSTFANISLSLETLACVLVDVLFFTFHMSII